MSDTTAAPPAGPLMHAINHLWLRPFNDWEAWDELLSPFGTTFAVQRCLGRVTAIEAETADTRTVRLQVNRNWPGFVAGQHAVLMAEIDGRLVKRPFSLTSDPADRHNIAFTVKRNDRGRLSPWLHQHLKLGDRLRLGLPAGSFVLPDPRPPQLLMIGAGSGITPFRSMLQTLRNEGYSGQVTLLQLSRDRADAIYADHFEALAARWPAFRWLPWYSTERGRAQPADLLAALADLPGSTATLLCGPGQLTAAVHATRAERGDTGPLLTERYGLPVIPVSGSDTTVTVQCSRSGIQLTMPSGQPLLPALESAGLTPHYGCRAGICHSCRYHKTSGMVHNLLNGDVSAEPDEVIQLCVCAPQSDVVLADL